MIDSIKTETSRRVICVICVRWIVSQCRLQYAVFRPPEVRGDLFSARRMHNITISQLEVHNIWTSNHLFPSENCTLSTLITYRCIFHPLGNIPGPLGCRISSSWFATHTVKQDAFRQLERLHSGYGPFLRIGSNDISVAHPKAVQAMYGPGSKCRKAA